MCGAEVDVPHGGGARGDEALHEIRIKSRGKHRPVQLELQMHKLAHPPVCSMFGKTGLWLRNELHRPMMLAGCA